MSDSKILDWFKNALIFATAATGLVSAACLSALPSTACYALANAYAIFLYISSFMFFFYIGGFFILYNLEIYADFEQSRLSHQKIAFRVFQAFSLVVISIIIFSLVMTAIYGATNIRKAIDHCYLGDEQRRGINLHSKIPLYRDPFSPVPR